MTKQTDQEPSGMRPLMPSCCSECPFRRQAAPGWLGPYSATEFAAAAVSGQIPCHMEHGADANGRFRGSVADARQCHGQAVYLRNKCAIPREPVHRADKPNRVGYFTNEAEFIAHHERKASK